MQGLSGRMAYKKLFYNTIYRGFSVNSHGKFTKPKPSNDLVTEGSEKSIKSFQITKDQRLILANKDELELFNRHEMLPSRPIDVENSVIVRLVKLSDPVTSPIGSALLCSQYGLKKGESLTFTLMCLTSISILITLGFWQLDRSKWKAETITYRQLNLSLPMIYINGLSNLSDCSYRIVEASGVLDVKNEFYVGPRSSLKGDGETGFLVVCPLRFNDGSCIIVNRGWIAKDFIEGRRRDDEIPEWVTVRGVITGGELVDNPIGMAKNSIFKFKNSPFRRNSKLFMYLDPSDIGDHIISKYPDEAKQVVLNAYDIMYHDDQPMDPLEAKSKFLGSKFGNVISGNFKDIVPIPEFYKPTLNLSNQDHHIPKNCTDDNKVIQSKKNEKRRRYTQYFQTKSKTDYLTFYADEHTHVNYAIQWFLMAASLSTMMVYKLVSIRKLRRFIQTRIGDRHIVDNARVD
ncbi:SURF1 family [Babesia microti strain RI]|uniref:SURF1-like protein n=1 Tax=Babesia microti (strain RI) TaxID=1133968 RepID=I7J6M4_BABMR|nr:SURF1 family [Babesia microti strain RI]CCF73917.1 SURF1 family [Babesia microti strain RI]|eukprot:XP_012648526.1 SURF1 family [Babesia microti strain RI]